jgi:ribosomal protein S1
MATDTPDNELIQDPDEKDDLFEAEDDDEERMPADWAESMDAAPVELKEGQIVVGTVIAIDPAGVLVDVGAKLEGFIPRSEFASEADMPKPDDQVEVAVVRVDDEHDKIRLSKRRADFERVWNELEELAKTQGTVEATVTERVKGGLRVDVGVPGFVPASHVGTRNVRNLERFVGRVLRLKVLEADRAAKKVVLSHRELVEEEREERRKETLARLEPGAICEGKVRNITNYGAFVDLGGVDGLLHVTEMSWTRVSHPSEAVRVGDTVRVVVLEIEDGGNRISLSMRQILPDPWKEAASKLKINSIVKARITRVVRTGAFAQLLEAGIEGFIPIRELSERRIGEPSEVVQVGQDVDLRILEIRKEARRMSLSLVAAEQEKEREQYRQFMDAQVSDRPTLGDRFGAVLQAALQTAEPEEPAQEAAAEEAPAAEPAPEAAPAQEPAAPEAPSESEGPAQSEGDAPQ